MRFGRQIKMGDQYFNTVSIIMTANLYVQDWAESRILVDINLLYESLFRSEVLCILGINAATLVLFSVSFFD